METFFPSEVARLILGYLKEVNCMRSWEIFLEESPDLHEYFLLYQNGQIYTTNVDGKSLLEILSEYYFLKKDQNHNIIDCESEFLKEKSTIKLKNILEEIVERIIDLNFQKYLPLVDRSKDDLLSCDSGTRTFPLESKESNYDVAESPTFKIFSYCTNEIKDTRQSNEEVQNTELNSESVNTGFDIQPSISAVYSLDTSAYNNLDSPKSEQFIILSENETPTNASESETFSNFFTEKSFRTIEDPENIDNGINLKEYFVDSVKSSENICAANSDMLSDVSVDENSVCKNNENSVCLSVADSPNTSTASLSVALNSLPDVQQNVFESVNTVQTDNSMNFGLVNEQQIVLNKEIQPNVNFNNGFMVSNSSLPVQRTSFNENNNLVLINNASFQNQNYIGQIINVENNENSSNSPFQLPLAGGFCQVPMPNLFSFPSIPAYVLSQFPAGGLMQRVSPYKIMMNNPFNGIPLLLPGTPFDNPNQVSTADSSLRTENASTVQVPSNSVLDTPFQQLFFENRIALNDKKDSVSSSHLSSKMESADVVEKELLPVSTDSFVDIPTQQQNYQNEVIVTDKAHQVHIKDSCTLRDYLKQKQEEEKMSGPNNHQKTGRRTKRPPKRKLLCLFPSPSPEDTHKTKKETAAKPSACEIPVPPSLLKALLTEKPSVTQQSDLSPSADCALSVLSLIAGQCEEKHNCPVSNVLPINSEDLMSKSKSSHPSNAKSLNFDEVLTDFKENKENQKSNDNSDQKNYKNNLQCQNESKKGKSTKQKNKQESITQINSQQGSSTRPACLANVESQEKSNAVLCYDKTGNSGDCSERVEQNISKLKSSQILKMGARHLQHTRNLSIETSNSSPEFKSTVKILPHPPVKDIAFSNNKKCVAVCSKLDDSHDINRNSSADVCDINFCSDCKVSVLEMTAAEILDIEKNTPKKLNKTKDKRHPLMVKRTSSDNLQPSSKFMTFVKILPCSPVSEMVSSKECLTAKNKLVDKQDIVINSFTKECDMNVNYCEFSEMKATENLDQNKKKIAVKQNKTEDKRDSLLSESESSDLQQLSPVKHFSSQQNGILNNFNSCDILSQNKNSLSGEVQNSNPGEASVNEIPKGFDEQNDSYNNLKLSLPSNEQNNKILTTTSPKSTSPYFSSKNCRKHLGKISNSEHLGDTPEHYLSVSNVNEKQQKKFMKKSKKDKLNVSSENKTVDNTSKKMNVSKMVTQRKKVNYNKKGKEQNKSFKKCNSSAISKEKIEGVKSITKNAKDMKKKQDKCDLVNMSKKQRDLIKKHAHRFGQNRKNCQESAARNIPVENNTCSDLKEKITHAKSLAKVAKSIKKKQEKCDLANMNKKRKSLIKKHAHKLLGQNRKNCQESAARNIPVEKNTCSDLKEKITDVKSLAKVAKSIRKKQEKYDLANMNKKRKSLIKKHAHKLGQNRKNCQESAARNIPVENNTCCDLKEKITDVKSLAKVAKSIKKKQEKCDLANMNKKRKSIIKKPAHKLGENRKNCQETVPRNIPVENNMCSDLITDAKLINSPCILLTKLHVDDISNLKNKSDFYVEQKTDSHCKNIDCDIRQITEINSEKESRDTNILTHSFSAGEEAIENYESTTELLVLKIVEKFGLDSVLSKLNELPSGNLDL